MTTSECLKRCARSNRKIALSNRQTATPETLLRIVEPTLEDMERSKEGRDSIG